MLLCAHVGLALLWSSSIPGVMSGDGPIFDCDHMYIHTDDGLMSGSFFSMNYPRKYPRNLQCIFTFVAKPHHRVKLVFENFSLAGSSSKCEDYIDIYSMMETPDVDLLSQSLTGRYCGTVSPKTIISLNSVAVIVFHVRSNSAGSRGFNGTYTFISDHPYTTGTRINPAECDYVIHSSQTPSGSILSPTYPGKYPGSMRCIYRMIGEAGQRIRLEFADFDVYFGGDHCPYDSLTIYDGASLKAPIVQKVCGLQQSLELFSDGADLCLEFISTNRVTEEHRGFKINFEFSRDFAPIGTLINGQPGVAHLRGTECDLRVRSSKENEILITSPNHPHSYHPATCTYYLDGLQGAQDLEKVLLHFELLSLTSVRPDCDEASIVLYLNGQDPKTENPDFKYCSANLGHLPDTVESNGPRLVLVLKTGNSKTDQGFKALVKFETDFGIPGTPASDSNECTFHFNSFSGKQGVFSSPRYPENYPVDTTCVYWLNGMVGERVRIYFDQFALAPSVSRVHMCADRLELFSVYADNRERLLGNYCAENYPGPILSDEDANRVRAVFFSDARPTATGFRANYEFISQRTSRGVLDGCAEKIISSISGTISTPNFPLRYDSNLICDWEIRVRPGFRVLVQPVVLNVEGMMSDDGWSSNCRSAVIRIMNVSSEYFKEFCGEKVVPGIRQFVSARNVIRISFLTHPEKVNGLKGFNLSWTEFKIDDDCKQPSQFRCNFSRYCVSSKVRCNELADCGEEDNSDEFRCKVDAEEEDKAVISVVITTVFVIATITVAIFIGIKRHRRMKRARKRLSKRIRQNVNRLAEHAPA